MADYDLKRLEAEFLLLARRIFDAGVQAERNRVIGLIREETAGDDPWVQRNAPRRKARATGYGAVSGPVRAALKQLATESPDGVGPRDIADHFSRLGSGPDERQVRAALKTLNIAGEAVRASRGRYLPRADAAPTASEEKSGGDAPDSFGLAAE
jgi:hypothetical protein